MYKPSIYNYYTTNDEDEVILYNSFTGEINKITRERKENFLKFNTNNFLDLEDENSELEKLVARGYFVSEVEDEKEKIILPFKHLHRGSSLNLIILPTEQCNFRCKYCYEDFNRGKMKKETQDAIIKYVRQNIHKYSSLRISWFGGEPLMAFDVIEYISNELIKICKVSRRSYFSDITTNGYFLSPEKFNILLKCNIIHYQITLDGLKEAHDSQRVLANGEGTFDTIINNLINISKNVKTSRFKIMIRTNFSLDMKEHVKEYIHYYDSLFGKDERFEFFIRTAGNWGGERVNEITDKLIDSSEHNLILDEFLKSDINLSLNSHLNFLQPTGSVCYACREEHLLIDSEGSLRRCTCDLENDEQNKIGYLDKDGKQILDPQKVTKWIAKMPDSEKCKNCFYLPSCLGNGCPSNNIKNKQPACPHEKKDLDLYLKLLDRCNDFNYIF